MSDLAAPEPTTVGALRVRWAWQLAAAFVCALALSFVLASSAFGARSPSPVWHADPLAAFAHRETRSKLYPERPLSQPCKSGTRLARSARLSPSRPGSRRLHSVVIKLSNGDDAECLYVNGRLKKKAGYDEYTQWSGKLRGTDVIDLQVYNRCCGYAWGLDVIVDDHTVYHDWAGTVTSYGANNNDGSRENQIVHAVHFRLGSPPTPPPDDSGLSSQWCGKEPRIGGNSTSTKRVPRIKLVYAYPSDRPDRFQQYAQLIQSDVQAVSDKVRESSLGLKSLRFDTGTSCGRRYVNVARVRLSKPLKYWRSGCARGDRLYAAAAEVKRALARDRKRFPLGHAHPLENYAIYADGFFGGRCLEAGIAQRSQDPLPAWQNRANDGGYVAMVNGGGEDVPRSGPPDFAEGEPVWYRRDTLLHEIMHNLGAVLNNAPHATGLGHCTDGPDLMCYDDGNGSRSWQTYPCEDPSATLQLLDCNSDDYFDPYGTLRDWRGRRMWNTYDSVFMCYVRTCTRNLKPPHARVTVGARTVHVGSAVSVSASGSTAGASAITHYEWFLANERGRARPLRQLSDRPSAEIRLTKAGIARLAVRVTDAYGSYSVAWGAVRVVRASRAGMRQRQARAIGAR